MQFKLTFKVEVDHPEDGEEWFVTTTDLDCTKPDILLPQGYIDFILEQVRYDLESKYTIQEPT